MGKEMIKIQGYAPDLPSFTPGVITSCSAMVPSLKGMKGAPSAQNTTLPALSAQCKGAAVLRKLDNSTRFIAGTATTLQEASGSSWIDRSRTSSAYSLGTETRWRFAILGDQVIAAAKTEVLQISPSMTEGETPTLTDSFNDVASNAPKGAAVEVVGGFTILVDVNDISVIYDGNDRPHGWWAARNVFNWTPSIAAEAYTGELTSTPGKCRAVKRFGQSAIIYKDRSMYVLSYIGQSGWEANLIPGEAGAVSQEVVVDIGTLEDPVHLFMGSEDFYKYDGSRPVSIGTPLTKTVFGDINKNLSYASMALHDRVEKNVYFYYPVGSTGNPDRCVVYNYKTGMWGRDDRTVEAVIEYIQAWITYDELGTYYSTYNDLPNASYDLAFWSAGFPSPAIISSDHKPQTLNGPSQESAMVMGDYGSDEFVSLLSRAQPLFTTKPATATMRNFYRANLGDAITTDQDVVMDVKGRFDVLRRANWHRPQFEFIGDVEFGALRLDLEESGSE
jgi:hypothetical protein